jgi:hypothetical protein
MKGRSKTSTRVPDDGFETSLLKTMSLASENQITFGVEQRFVMCF